MLTKRLSPSAQSGLHIAEYTRNPRPILPAIHGHLPVVELLSINGADVNIRRGNSSNALHGVSQNGHTGVVSDDRFCNMPWSAYEPPPTEALRRHFDVFGCQDHQWRMNRHGERSTVGAQKRVAGNGASTRWDALHTHTRHTRATDRKRGFSGRLLTRSAGFWPNSPSGHS